MLTIYKKKLDITITHSKISSKYKDIIYNISNSFLENISK